MMPARFPNSLALQSRLTRLPSAENGATLRRGPPPAYARCRGTGCWRGRAVPQVHPPASYAGRGGGPVSGARRPRAGRYRLSRPC